MAAAALDLLDGVRVAWRAVADAATRRDAAWTLLGEMLPGARVSNPCPRCGGPHGPVRIAGVDAVANVAYTGAWAVVAVAEGTGVRALGIDAETVPPPGDDDRMPRLSASLERVLGRSATLRDWVRVEAALKADGRGLRVDPAHVRLDTAEAAPERWRARVAGRSIRVLGRDVPGPAGVLVSVAAVPARGSAG